MAHTNKLTATEIMKGSADRLGDGRPMMFRSLSIKRVALKHDFYCLFFMGKGMGPIRLTASMVLTLAEAFGGDCDGWKGKPVTLVNFDVELRVREEDFTTYVDDNEPTTRPRKSKPVLSVVRPTRPP